MTVPSPMPYRVPCPIELHEANASLIVPYHGNPLSKDHGKILGFCDYHYGLHH